MRRQWHPVLADLLYDERTLSVESYKAIPLTQSGLHCIVREEEGGEVLHQ